MLFRSNPGISLNGLWFGESKLFLMHLTAMAMVAVFVGAGTWVLLKVTDWIVPLRVSADDEALGLDKSQHDEKL